MQKLLCRADSLQTEGVNCSTEAGSELLLVDYCQRELCVLITANEEIFERIIMCSSIHLPRIRVEPCGRAHSQTA